MYGGLRGGGLLALQQAQVGGLQSHSGFAATRRHGLSGATGFPQGAISGHFGRGRHHLMSGLGQTGAASIPATATPSAPGGATPAQATTAASPTNSAPVDLSSSSTASTATLVTTQTAGDSQASTSPVAVSGMTGQAMPGQIAVTGGWGQAAASQTSTTTGTNTAKIDPATVEKDFQKLGTDLQAIHDKSQVTPALLAAVRKDVEGLQKESTSAPTQASLATLKSDLLALGGATPDFTTGQLQTDLEAAIKSAGVNDTVVVSTLEHDLNAVATAMNITPADVQTVQADQKAIATDLGSTAPADPSSGPLAVLELPLLGALDPGGSGDPGPELIGSGNVMSGFAGTGQFIATGSPMSGPAGPVMLMRGGLVQSANAQSIAMPLAMSGQAGSVQGMPFLQGPYGGPWRI
jgi:hypothetical protein